MIKPNAADVAMKSSSTISVTSGCAKVSRAPNIPVRRKSGPYAKNRINLTIA